MPGGTISYWVQLAVPVTLVGWVLLRPAEDVLVTLNNTLNLRLSTGSTGILW